MANAAQTPGDRALREGHAVDGHEEQSSPEETRGPEGGRGGDLVDVPVRFVLVADDDKRLGPNKPFPHTLPRESTGGGRGERGPGVRMYQSCAVSRPHSPAGNGALPVRSLSLRSHTWREEPNATKSRSPVREARERSARRPEASASSTRDPPSAPEGRSAGHRPRHRRSKGRSKSTVVLVGRRRFGPGKYRRFTTSVWKRSRRASRNRRRAHRENARRLRPVSAKLATGASEARSLRVRVPQQSGPRKAGEGSNRPTRMRAIRRSGMCAVKAHGLRSRWAAPIGFTRGEEPQTMSRKQKGYGCSLTECWEAETDRTHL